MTKICVMCGDEITQPYQQFGDIGEEVCIVCWLKYGVDGAPDSWYGLGPHVHSYDENDMLVVGGTTFLPLDGYEKDGSSYLIDGCKFTPDPEASGCGIWSRK